MLSMDTSSLSECISTLTFVKFIACMTFKYIKFIELPLKVFLVVTGESSMRLVLYLQRVSPNIVPLPYSSYVLIIFY